MSTLKDELRDADYRRAYAESLANTLIATQIRLLRGEMTQAQFAEAVGMKQSRISAMEDENYAAWSTKTLKAIAAKRDVVFIGRFLSFGQMLDVIRGMTPEGLRVPSFEQDPAFQHQSQDGSGLVSNSQSAASKLDHYPQDGAEPSVTHDATAPLPTASVTNSTSNVLTFVGWKPRAVPQVTVSGTLRREDLEDMYATR